MLKQKFQWICLLGCLNFLCACGEQTPMQKLASCVRLDDMTPEFWGKEHTQNTPLWQEAKAYCFSHLDKPNCGVVAQIQIFSAGQTQMPDLRRRPENEIQLYDFGQP